MRCTKHTKAYLFSIPSKTDLFLIKFHNFFYIVSHCQFPPFKHVYWVLLFHWNYRKNLAYRNDHQHITLYHHHAEIKILYLPIHQLMKEEASSKEGAKKQVNPLEKACLKTEVPRRRRVHRILVSWCCGSEQR